MSQQPSTKASLSPKPSIAEMQEHLESTRAPSENKDSAAAIPKARSISFAGPSTGEPRPPSDRRTSIQFAPRAVKPEDAKPAKITIAESVKPVEKRQGRMPSPPPPSTYQARVSFDTFNNSSVTDQEFTLVSKHRGYTYARHSRVFLVAIDQNAYSEHALKWLIEEMVEDGDEVICLRVVENDTKADKAASKDQMITYKNDAKELLEQIQAKNDAADKKALSIIMEFAVGSVEETILHMINIYSPAFLTVGTRGKSLGGLQGLLPGSVSKWCMQNSPVPVVIVRSPEKRQKKMEKRQNDPNRKGYAAILGQTAGHTKTIRGGKIIEASENEADAVAKAVGLSSRLAGWKGFGTSSPFKKEGNAAGNGAGSAALSLRGEPSKGEETDEGDEREAGGEKEEGEEEEGEEEEEEESDEESPTGPMFGVANSRGIESMPNYKGEPEDDKSDEDVERLALSDEDGKA